MLVVRILALLLLASSAAAQAAPRPCGTSDPESCCTTIAPEYASFDVDSLRNVTNESQVAQVRSELRDLVWPSLGHLPTGLPAVSTDILHWTQPSGSLVIEGLPTQIDTTNPDMPFERIDKLSHAITIPAGTFTTHAWLFVPENPNGRAVVVHQGHSSIPGQLFVKEAVRNSVIDGFHVVWIAMLGRLPNEIPPGPPDYNLHVDANFEALETPTFHPLSLFLEPAIVMVNYLDAQGFDEINWIGHSGGGWTGVWAAALDTRIQRLFENAGSQPEYLNQATTSCSADGTGNDYEQQHDERDGIATMIDLYLLASHGNGRSYHAYRNQFDNCCFAGIKYQTYSAKLDGWVDELNAGDYTVMLQSTDDGHALHTEVREDIRTRLAQVVPSFPLAWRLALGALLAGVARYRLRAATPPTLGRRPMRSYPRASSEVAPASRSKPPSRGHTTLREDTRSPLTGRR